MSLERSQPSILQQIAPAESAPSAPPAAAPVAAAGGEQPFFRLDIWRALEMHRWLAMGFAALGLGLAAAYVAMNWPVYTAGSQIYIQPSSSKILDQSANQQRWPYDSNSYDSYIQQQVQSASNPGVLVNALHKLPAGAWQQENENEQAAAERLGHALQAERLGSSYQVEITAQAKDPGLAAQIANAVANSIVEKAAHEENAGDSQRVTILEAERDRVQNQLNADLAEQDALNKQLGMAAVGSAAPDLIDNAIGATREELIKARTEHDEAEARYAALAGKSASSAAMDAEADELVAADPGLTSMKTSLNQRRAALITKMNGLTPNNPEYKLDSEELAKINSSVDGMMQGLRVKASAQIEQKLRTDLERTAGVEAQLNGQLRQLAATAASATPKLQRANDLVSDIGRLRARYASVDEALHNIMLEDSVPGAVHLSVAAVQPLHPAFGKILRKVLPLVLGGFLLGLMAALIAHNLDRRIYIGADVSHVLGFLPMVSLPDCGQVPEEVYEEHVLRLATAIDHARAQRRLRSCIFTGTGPGTGVTTVAAQVSKMLVAMGRPAVLADAMGAAPVSQRRNGQGRSPDGLAEGYGAELGTRSLALLEHLNASAVHDDVMVLTDAAPLTISAETEYLVRKMDCAIVVLESGVTTRAQLRATADTLRRLNVGAVGFVLNRVNLAKADRSFRASVHDMEKHLRAQSRTGSRGLPERSIAPPLRDLVEERISERLTREVGAERVTLPLAPPPAAEPEPVHVPPMPAVPSAPPKLAIRPEPASPAQSQTAAPDAAKPAAAARAPLPPPARLPASLPPVAPPPQMESDMPWWLAETPPKREAAPEPAAPLVQPSASEPEEIPVAESRLGALRNVLFGRTPEAKSKPSVPGAAEPETPPPASAPVPSPADDALSTRAFFETAAQSLWNLPQAPAASSKPPKRPSSSEMPGDLFVPVSETLVAPPQAHEPEAEDLREVTAVPEFLPPQLQRQVTPENETAARRDRRDTMDDIAVLPSWRGQYRRK